MSGLKPKFPGEDQPRNPGCLVTQDVPAVCLRLQSHRQQIALPYALLLRAELSEDATTCVLIFATHEISVRGRHLREVYLAVSRAQAAEVSIGQSAILRDGATYLGPLVTEIRIEPTDGQGRARQ
ncbi:MAG: hypothetical protein PSV13_07520 [Lacunisphaera sp.]|nr:hypothetical protein [Lacunisphaera sp.]